MMQALQYKAIIITWDRNGSRSRKMKYHFFSSKTQTQREREVG